MTSIFFFTSFIALWSQSPLIGRDMNELYNRLRSSSSKAINPLTARAFISRKAKHPIAVYSPPSPKKKQAINRLFSLHAIHLYIYGACITHFNTHKHSAHTHHAHHGSKLSEIAPRPNSLPHVALFPHYIHTRTYTNVRIGTHPYRPDAGV